MKGFRPGDAEKSVTVSCALVEACLPKPAYSLTLALGSMSSIMYLNLPYLTPLWEGMGMAFLVEGCIPAQNIAVPCLPAGEGSAGSYTCVVAELVQICLVCCSECFYVTATSVYSAVRYSEVFHCCQFILRETEAELQGWRADEKETEVRYLRHRCSVCNRKQGLYWWWVL